MNMIGLIGRSLKKVGLIANDVKDIARVVASVMLANGWLYVFGFATHILSFKAIQPIGKTDIYNVLPTGTVNSVGN